MAKKLMVRAAINPEDEVFALDSPTKTNALLSIDSNPKEKTIQCPNPPTLQAIPSPDSLGWTDYVLSLLSDDEKVENFPLSSGLRRIFTLIHGPITNQMIDVLQTPDHNNGNRATVKCTINFTDKLGNEFIISDASDCFHGNTVKPYSAHPVATAATMAEARCLRKALRLNTMTVEENRSPDEQTLTAEQDAIPAEDNQIFAIQTFCKKLNIDTVKTIKIATNSKVDVSLKELSKNDAGTVMRYINDLRRGTENGGKNIPAEILLG